MSMIDALRRLVRQQTVQIGQPVANIYGAVAGVSPKAEPEAAQSWLWARIPGGSLPSLDEFYAQYSLPFAATRIAARQQVVTGSGGTVVVSGTTQQVQLLRGVLIITSPIILTLTASTAASQSEFCIYVDGVIQRRGVDSLAQPLTLDVGRHEVEVLAFSQSLGINIPTNITVEGAAESPGAPTWQSLTTGWLDPVLGLPMTTLSWFNDARVGGWRVFRRVASRTGTIASVSSIQPDGTFAVSALGNFVTQVQLGDQVGAGGDTMGVVVGVSYNGSTTTTVNIQLARGFDTPKQTWVGSDLTAGRYTELTNVRRSGSSGSVTYTDASVTSNILYEYLLVAYGIYDQVAASPASESRLVLVGDTTAPASVTFAAGSPSSVNGRITALYHTPADTDYAGVRVYFRDRPRTGNITSATATTVTTALSTTPNEFTGYTFRFLSGVASGDYRVIASHTSNLFFASGAQWNASLTGGVAFEIINDLSVVVDSGVPNADDSVSFLPVVTTTAPLGYGTYYFSSFDYAGNEQIHDQSPSFTLSSANDLLSVIPAATVRLRTVAGSAGSTDLYVAGFGKAANFPATIAVYENDPTGAALGTVTATANGTEYGKANVAAFGGRATGLLGSERKWYAKITDALGNVSWNFATTDGGVNPALRMVLSETANTGTITMFPVDALSRITRVTYDTALGNAPFSGTYTALTLGAVTTGAYVATVGLVEKQTSKIAWRLYATGAGDVEQLVDEGIERFAIGGRPVDPIITYTKNANGSLDITVKSDSDTNRIAVAVTFDGPAVGTQLDAAATGVTALLNGIATYVVLNRVANWTSAVPLTVGQVFYITAAAYNTSLTQVNGLADQRSTVVNLTDQWLGPSAGQATVSITGATASNNAVTLSGITFGATTSQVELYMREFVSDPGTINVAKIGHKVPGTPLYATTATQIVPGTVGGAYLLVTAVAVDSLNRVGQNEATGTGVASGQVTIKLQLLTSVPSTPQPPATFTLAAGTGSPNPTTTAVGTITMGSNVTTPVPVNTLRISRSDIGVIANIASPGASNPTTFTDPNRTPLTTYSYTVYSVNTSGGVQSATGITTSITMPAASVPAPSISVDTYSKVWDPNGSFAVSVTPASGTPTGTTWQLEHSSTSGTTGFSAFGSPTTSTMIQDTGHPISGFDASRHNHWIRVYGIATGYSGAILYSNVVQVTIPSNTDIIRY